jgi:quercetin dioxygenase-like cupin family protein
MDFAKSISWFYCSKQTKGGACGAAVRGHDMGHPVVSAGVIAALLVAAAPAKAQDSDIIAVTPDKLKWVSTPIAPTNKIAWGIGSAAAAGKFYVLFASYPPGGKSMPHVHPDERIVTVLTGTFHLGSGPDFDETKAKALTAGTVITIPANVVHWGFAKDTGVTIQEVGVGPTATTPSSPSTSPTR